MIERRYLYCACGRVFHPDYADDFRDHTNRKGHTATSDFEKEMFLRRLCSICKKGVGDFSYGNPGMRSIPVDMSYWVCRSCVEQAVRVGA